MSRLSVQVEYNKKIEELHNLIQEEAKKLQNVINKKDEILLDIKNLSNRKTALVKGIADLEKEISSKQENLNQLVERETSFVSSIKVELNKEKSSLEDISKIKKKAKEELEGLNKVTLDLNDFIEKEKKIREKYLEEKKKLDITQSINKKINSEINIKLEELNNKNKELDIYKKYLVDLYGKLSSYIKVAEESIIYVNDFMDKNGVPMQFELPPGEIIKIDFNNFNNKRVDT